MTKTIGLQTNNKHYIKMYFENDWENITYVDLTSKYSSDDDRNIFGAIYDAIVDLNKSEIELLNDCLMNEYDSRTPIDSEVNTKELDIIKKFINELNDMCVEVA